MFPYLSMHAKHYRRFVWSAVRRLCVRYTVIFVLLIHSHIVHCSVLWLWIAMFPDWLVKLLEEHRGLVVVLFCLPISYLFDICLKLSNWIRRRRLSAPEQHYLRVGKIQESVREWNKLPAASRQPMCTSRPNWLSLSTTFFQKSQCHQIQVALFDILRLNEKEMTIKVEPMVSVGEITSYLVPRGYALAVTLEIADATCGGLAMAVGMTTYSHKVGLYQESVVSYDVVLADGRLAHVTKDNEYKDLFHCLPWSHGTLGLLVAVELKIVPVKPYVHLRYIPVRGQQMFCNEIRRLSGALSPNARTPDYLEATVFGKDEAVLMVGNLADVKTERAQLKINHVARWELCKECFGKKKLFALLLSLKHPYRV